jgi:probable O-glycosylation ligase (exosortase A-associated)
MAIAVYIMAAVMPQEWYDRMNTINTYQEDQSAQGRINAWHTAFNVAKDRITGGGFEIWFPPTFRQYAPDPSNVRDVHSIYFEIMGEQGFVGFGLFMALGLMPGYARNRSSIDARKTLTGNGRPACQPWFK